MYSTGRSVTILAGKVITGKPGVFCFAFSSCRPFLSCLSLPLFNFVCSRLFQLKTGLSALCTLVLTRHIVGIIIGYQCTVE